MYKNPMWPETEAEARADEIESRNCEISNAIFKIEAGVKELRHACRNADQLGRGFKAVCELIQGDADDIEASCHCLHSPDVEED